MTATLSIATILADDLDATLPFYTDVLGLTLANDVANGGFRWLTLVSPDAPDLQVLLTQPHAGRSQDDGDALARLLAKGSLPQHIFTTDDLDATFAAAQAAGVEILQEPADQFWGVRDCSVRDPAGNTLRINQRA